MWDSIFSNEAYLIIALGFMFGMFERVFDLIETIWWWLMPFEVVDQYDMAVVLRWGIYSRTVGPGFRWMLPFGIEEMFEDTVVRTTSYLDVQSITSKDGMSVNIGAILVYKIGNIKRWMLEVDDAEEALHDVTYGLITELAETKSWGDIMKPEFMEEVTELVQEEGLTWGARVEAVKLSDRANSRSLRLWTGLSND